MDRLASMETFIRAVETGSFSGAARQLRVGQPAVSKTVAQLESHQAAHALDARTDPNRSGAWLFRTCEARDRGG